MMTTLKDYVYEVLSDLSKSQPTLTIAKFREILRAFLQAKSVEITGPMGKKHLQNAVDEAMRITINMDYKPENAESKAALISPQPRSPGSTSFPPGAERASVTDEDPRFVRFIRELEKLERVRRFVWIGYLAKEMLPQLGFVADEVNDVLDCSRSEGIVTLGKVPNPKNPDFPATCVRLNREHPVVRRALNDGRSTERRFPLGRISGEPLSETIIRERR